MQPECSLPRWQEPATCTLSLSLIKVDCWLHSPGFEFRQGQESLRPPTRPDQFWGTPSVIFNGHRGPSPGVKRPGPEADHSPPSRVEFNNKWIYTSTLHVQYVFMVRTRTTLPFVHLFSLRKLTPSPDFFTIWTPLKQWPLVPTILGNLHSPWQ